MAELEVPLAGGSHSNVVRVGETVRRAPRRWSTVVQDLLRHLEQEGFAGAPRALGFDDQGREVLSYLEGASGLGTDLLPDEGGRFDHRVHAEVWKDEVLVGMGVLMRRLHDAASTFPWEGRDWCFEAREPVETICHNELFPQNTVLRDGLPVGLIDWDTASPGPRAWDVGSAAWRWVPFWRDEKCRAHGLPAGVADKARRFRLLLDAYGMEPGLGIVRQAIERAQEFVDQSQRMADEGSPHEVDVVERGVLDELRLEVAWMEEHAAALVEG